MSHPVDDADLRSEARLFAKYLVGRIPAQEFMDRYRDANRELLDRSFEPRDAAVLGFAVRHPWSISLLDAASGLLRPGNVLRTKILIMGAILEASPGFADDFLPRDTRPAPLVLSLALLGLTAAVRATAGILLYAIASRS